MSKDQRILIDLYAIFDTRLAAVSMLDPDLAIKLLVSPKYRERKTGDWGEISDGVITTEQFLEVYKNPTKELLERSIVTSMPRIVGDFTKSLQWKGIVNIDVDKVSLRINTWPHKLTSAEKRDLRDCMSIFTSATCTIDFVHVSLQEMTPQVLDSLGDIWVTYEYNDWLAVQIDNLTRYRIPLMTILTPEILYNPESFNEKDLIDKELNGVFDPFMVHQVTMCEFVAVEFYPPFTFSAIITDQS